MDKSKSHVSPAVPSTLDKQVLDLLRPAGSMRVNELTAALGVTATAVRHRLNRLLASGLVERSTEGSGRGRPSHRYKLTEAGLRTTGSNFADLAVALWHEIKSIPNIEVRRGLLQRLSQRLAGFYKERIVGDSIEERMQSVAQLLQEREIPFEVVTDGDLPVLTAVACPYTELAEQDRSICSMERLLFSELLGHGLSLSQCRLDGKTCCTFELN